MGMPAPQKYALYTKKAGKYIIAVNTECGKGVQALNPSAAKLLERIDGKRSIHELYNIYKDEEPDLKFRKFCSVLKYFEKERLIYFGEKASLPDPDLLSIWFQMTDSCNLRCKYCYVPKVPRFMNLETGKKAMDMAFVTAMNYNYKKIKIKFAGGEPLLNFGLIKKVIDYGYGLSIQHSIQIQFSIVTNGTLLNEKIIDYLKSRNISVGISLDGIGEIHDMNRPTVEGTGSFNEVVKGLLLLKEHGINFNASVVITKNNVSQLIPIADYLLSRNIPFVFNIVRDNDNSVNGLSPKHSVLIKKFKELYRFIEINYPECGFLEKLCDTIIKFKARKYSCGSCQNYFAVSSDGKISTCQMNPCAASNLDDEDPLKKLRSTEQAKYNLIENKTDCSFCSWKNLCGGGCTLLSRRAYGKYGTKSPLCSIYKKLIPELILLEGKRLIGNAGLSCSI